MLKSIFILFSIFIVSCSFGQTSTDSIPIAIEYGSKDKEFMEFLQFLNIDKHTITISDPTVKNKILHIRLREFVDGKLTRTEDLLNNESLKFLYKFPSTDSAMQFRVWTHQFSKDSLKIFLRFKRHSITKKFRTFCFDEYSLRNPNEIQGDNPKLPRDNFTPFLVYSLPYQDPKNPTELQYCTLTRDGVKPELWGQTFKIKHYILLEMKFE